MGKGKAILAVVLVLAGAGYIWWAGQAVESVDPENAVNQDVERRGGGGDQADRQDEASSGEDCGTRLALYQGPQRLWRRSVEEVNAMPESRPLAESHQPDMQALNLFELASTVPGTAIVEVVTCEGRIARFPVDRLEEDAGRFYVAPNRRGAFKLVELYEGTEHTALRNVRRIILKPDGQRRIDGEADPT